MSISLLIVVVVLLCFLCCSCSCCCCGCMFICVYLCLSVFIFSHVCEEGRPRGREAFGEEGWVLQFQAMDLLWSRCGQEDLSGVQRHLLQRTQGSGWTFGGERFPDSWCSLSYGRLLLFGCGFVSFVYLQDYSNAIRRIIWRLECWRIGMCLYSFISG